MIPTDEQYDRICAVIDDAKTEGGDTDVYASTILEVISLPKRGTAVTTDALVSYFRGQADRHRLTAQTALRQLIAQAERQLDDLDQGGNISPDIGGSVLNRQVFEDAERALVRSWDATNAGALAERLDA